VAAEARETNNRYAMTTRQALISPQVLTLSMVYFAIVFGLYGLDFWILIIIKRSLSIQDNFVVTLLVSMFVGGLALVLIMILGAMAVLRLGSAPPLTARCGALVAVANSVTQSAP
jgi:hypothetical protein